MSLPHFSLNRSLRAGAFRRVTLSSQTKDSVIIPSILTWRQGVEAVFEKLDLAFNHSRVRWLSSSKHPPVL